MTEIRIAQYGTKHAHAAGKLRAIQQNPNVELAGVFEPDPQRRQAMAGGDSPYGNVYWFGSESEMLDDASIAAIASEGPNHQSLDQTERCVRAGKHVWYDKPAGDNWPQWQNTVALAGEQGLTIQMGYMFRYHAGFRQIGEWAQSGLLGDIFAIRTRIGTSIDEEGRREISRHRGGVFFELAGHVLDQVVWLLGRPQKVTAFLRNDAGVVPEFADNTLGVFEFERAMALIDTSAMETRPPARRFEIYGSRGSAIMEPLEPATHIRLCLAEAQAGYGAGKEMVPIQTQTRQELYDLALVDFLATIQGAQPATRPLSHELLVQETLLRATGEIAE